MNQCKKVITLSKMGAPPKLQRWQVKMVRMYQAELQQAALLDFDDLLVEVMLAEPCLSLTHTHTHTHNHTYSQLPPHTCNNRQLRTLLFTINCNYDFFVIRNALNKIEHSGYPAH